MQKQADALAKELIAHIDEHGGKERSTVTCGHRLSMISKPGRVAWKDAFVEAQGIEAAEALTKACPPTLSLQVDPL